MKNQRLSFTNFLLVILYLFAKVTNHGRPQEGGETGICTVSAKYLSRITSYLKTIKNSSPQLFSAQRRELFTQICKAVTFTY